MRVLDELADALHQLRGTLVPRTVVSSTRLLDQFDRPLTPSLWQGLQDNLRFHLPLLEARPGDQWAPPRGWLTVWDVVDYIAAHRSGCERPAADTPAAWREAQVFLGVRDVLTVVGNLDPEQVVRPARLVADLGLE